MRGPDTPVEFEAVLQAKKEVADGVVHLTLARADGGDLPPWTPGAHTGVQLTPDLVRQYSLCGRPDRRKVWELAVLREEVGRGGSAHVHDRLVVGERVTLRGPRNNFPLDPAPRYLFLAGGIGITPILPMIEAAQAAGADWTLVYGGRRRAAMAFTERLAAHGERVRLLPQDEHGLLPLPQLLGAPQPRTLVYCCGPEPLLAAAEEHCTAWPAGALRVERFAPVAPPDTGSDRAIEIECARSGVTVTVPADRPILDCLEEAGLPVLSSCREGTCGTCETDVLDGVPDHRDVLLDDAERESGKTMMICVSRARSERLVLDL